MSIAILTMVFEDDFFLERWIKYYSQFVPKRQLIILTHGLQEKAWDIAQGCSIIELHRDSSDRQLDAHRWGTMTHFCRGLLLQYRQVICLDVDEFLVADPGCGKSLDELVANMPKNQTWHTNSMEIVHRTDLEPEFDPSITNILDQRSFFRTNSWYSKPCITTDRDIVWKMDGHCTYHRIRIHKDLFLVHLKWFDRDFVLKRAQIRHDFMRDETGKVFMNAGGMWGAGMEDWAREVNSFESMPISEEPCDFASYRSGILAAAGPVGDDGVVNYPRQTSKVLYRVPKEFVGLF